MPININPDLPAKRSLEAENIFVMSSDRAKRQDIRPLEIAIVNLMPSKIDTEIQLMRLLGNSPLQVNIDLLHTESYRAKHSNKDYLSRFYTTFSKIEGKRYDGMIITGAPVETLAFEQVDYWDELCAIMDYSKGNVFSTLHICWGAQAGLYHHYGIGKKILDKKLFGIYSYQRGDDYAKLFQGFDDQFFVPQSRYTEIDQEALEAEKELTLLSASDEGGVCVALSRDGRRVFSTGHLEYDTLTLAHEYQRDRSRGLKTALPKNYFPQDNPELYPVSSWRSHAHLFFSNWLNYYVYQASPFDLSSLEELS